VGTGVLEPPVDEFVDLATELEAELIEEGGLGDDLLPSVREQSLEDIVEGFRKGMAETLSEEDYDTHYNLGIAYREMGLIDEAIGEFQMAAKDARYLVECCSLLAACFVDKEFFDLAVQWYVRGLESPALDEPAKLGLLYELGTLLAVTGEPDAARARFREIYGINSNYRDVVAKLEELSH
jgi:tetratricopeptide (TPR) repeat protein